MPGPMLFTTGPLSRWLKAIVVAADLTESVAPYENNAVEPIITILNRRDAERYKPSVPAVLVSICDIDRKPVYIHEPGKRYLDVLKLRFDDITEIVFPHGHPSFVAEGAIGEYDAKRIARFVSQWKDRAQEFVFNCEAGFSRSAGAAAATCQILGISDDVCYKMGRLPNSLVKSLILRAHNDELRKDIREVPAWADGAYNGMQTDMQPGPKHSQITQAEIEITFARYAEVKITRSVPAEDAAISFSEQSTLTIAKREYVLSDGGLVVNDLATGEFTRLLKEQPDAIIPVASVARAISDEPLRKFFDANRSEIENYYVRTHARQNAVDDRFAKTIMSTPRSIETFAVTIAHTLRNMAKKLGHGGTIGIHLEDFEMLSERKGYGLFSTTSPDLIEFFTTQKQMARRPVEKIFFRKMLEGAQLDIVNKEKAGEVTLFVPYRPDVETHGNLMLTGAEVGRIAFVQLGAETSRKTRPLTINEMAFVMNTYGKETSPGIQTLRVFQTGIEKPTTYNWSNETSVLLARRDGAEKIYRVKDGAQVLEGPLQEIYDLNCHRHAEVIGADLGDKISQGIRAQFADIDPGKRYDEVLTCITSALRGRDGTTVREISNLCGMITPVETARRVDSLSADGLVNDAALTDIICKSGKYEHLDNYLKQLEETQKQMRDIVATEEYKERILERIDASEIDLSGRQLEQLGTLLSEGRMNYGDIEKALRQPERQDVFEKIIAKAFQTREIEMSQGFERSLSY